LTSPCCFQYVLFCSSFGQNTQWALGINYSRLRKAQFSVVATIDFIVHLAQKVHELRYMTMKKFVLLLSQIQWDMTLPNSIIIHLLRVSKFTKLYLMCIVYSVIFDHDRILMLKKHLNESKLVENIWVDYT